MTKRVKLAHIKKSQKVSKHRYLTLAKFSHHELRKAVVAELKTLLNGGRVHFLAYNMNFHFLIGQMC